MKSEMNKITIQMSHKSLNEKETMPVDNGFYQALANELIEPFHSHQDVI